MSAAALMQMISIMNYLVAAAAHARRAASNDSDSESSSCVAEDCAATNGSGCCSSGLVGDAMSSTEHMSTNGLKYTFGFAVVLLAIVAILSRVAAQFFDHDSEEKQQREDVREVLAPKPTRPSVSPLRAQRA